MKICIFGNKSSTNDLIKFLFDEGFIISTLVTLAPEKHLKIKISGSSSSLLDSAYERGIEVFFSESYGLTQENDQSFFIKQAFDVGISVGWQRLIPAEILKSFKFGVFGWHGSGFRFPNGRGRSPINWTIRLGLKSVYHNCFRYSSGADTGDIYDVRKIEVDENDYIADVQKKALQHIFASAKNLLNDIRAENLVLKKQSDQPFISFPSLNEASGFLSLNLLSGEEAINITHSCSKPFPGAFIKLINPTLCIRVWKINKTSHNSQLKIGEMMLIDSQLIMRFSDNFLCSKDFELIEESSVVELKKNITYGCF